MGARPLHRQRMMGREIVLVEQTDLHLTWSGHRIFIKPLPLFLLDYGFWKENICVNQELHARACGILLSYVWLVCEPSDLKVAIDANLLPFALQWHHWVTLVEDVIQHIDVENLGAVNKRYQYGELRLTRLNKIYRLAPKFRFKHFMRGYQSQDTIYSTFFQRKFAWLLIIFIYIDIMLNSAQVGLATNRLGRSLAFQRISFGLTMLFMFLPVAIITLIGVGSLFCFYTIL